MKIKLVFIISDLSLGGAQTLLLDIVNYLRLKEDLDITVLVVNSGEHIDKLNELGVKTIDLKEKGLFNVRIFLKLLKIIKDLKPDIVHTHLITADFYGRLAAKFAGVPVIYSTCHNYTFDRNEADMNKLSILDLIDNLVVSYTDSNLIAISEIVKRYLINRSKSFESVTEVIYNGIDINKERYKLGSDEAQKLRDELNISKDDFVISILGRLTMQKGHLFFLNSIKDFLKEKNNVRVLILGEGELREEIETLIKDNELSQYVKLLGFKSETEMYIEISDMICVPSLWEGFGLVIVEAMIKRKPVLASNVGGIPEIIEDGKSGFMFEANDKKSLLDKLNYMYDNPDRLDYVRSNALEIVKLKFDIRANTDRYYASYLRKLKYAKDNRSKI